MVAGERPPLHEKTQASERQPRFGLNSTELTVTPMSEKNSSDCRLGPAPSVAPNSSEVVRPKSTKKSGKVVTEW